MRFQRAWRVLAASALLLQGCASATAKKSVPHEVPQYSIEDFMGTTNINGASIAPDKSKILVSSNQTGIYNAFAVPVDGGAPVQLTQSKDNAIFALSYFPADERVLYMSDVGGNELDHLYVRDPQGAVKDLTPGPRLKANFEGWSQDDRSFFVTTNERDPRFFDVYEYATDGYARTLVYKDTTGIDFADASPDKRTLAFVKNYTTTNQDILLVDRASGAVRNVTDHAGEMKNSFQTFSPDGKAIYYTTDKDREFDYLVRFDLASGQTQIVEQPDWDVWYASFSKNGKYLVVSINADARTEVKVYEADGMKPVKLPQPPAGDITSVRISRDEQMMAYYASSSRMPNDLFVQDLPAGQPRQLTHSLNPKIDAAALVDAEVVRFKSYDGTEVPGLLYRPHPAAADAKVPGLVFVHGGPGDQTRVGYSPLVQYLVNHGYAIYGINNRGSSGYGKTFFKMDDRKHGEADLDDCVASKKLLAGTGWIEPDRIGIIGGSYGGYMVLAALAFRPEEFKVGVDVFGVANWVRTLENIPPWWESFRAALYREMGDPKTDAERLRRISPLFNYDKIDKPLMVLQGKNDPRVLKVESDEIVDAVKKKGVPVEYMVFDDEGHGFVNKANQIKGYKAILDFLDKHLRAQPPLAG